MKSKKVIRLIEKFNKLTKEEKYDLAHSLKAWYEIQRKTDDEEQVRLAGANIGELDQYEENTGEDVDYRPPEYYTTQEVA